MFDAPLKIYNIFERLKSSPYTGDIRCKHFAVGIRKGKIITPVSCNYHRINVLGENRGTMHAEMNVANYLINKKEKYLVNFLHEKQQCILVREWDYIEEYKSPTDKYLIKLKKKMNKIDILVFRDSEAGIRYSKPCSECISTMKRLNYRRVYYSLDNGSLVGEKISKISSNHRAQMTIHLKDNKLLY